MGGKSIPCLFDSLDFKSEEKDWKSNEANSDKHVSWTEGAEKPPTVTIKMKMSQLAVLKAASPSGKLVRNAPETCTFIFSNFAEKLRIVRCVNLMYTKVSEVSGDNSDATVDCVCDSIDDSFNG